MNPHCIAQGAQLDLVVGGVCVQDSGLFNLNERFSPKAKTDVSGWKVSLKRRNLSVRAPQNCTQYLGPGALFALSRGQRNRPEQKQGSTKIKSEVFHRKNPCFRQVFEKFVICEFCKRATQLRIESEIRLLPKCLQQFNAMAFCPP